NPRSLWRPTFRTVPPRRSAHPADHQASGYRAAVVAGWATLQTAMTSSAKAEPPKRWRPGDRREPILRLLLAPGSGSPLAFVHGLHARHRYRVALIDQVLGKFLWGGHFRLPGVAGAEEFRHGSQREIGRCDVVQV